VVSHDGRVTHLYDVIAILAKNKANIPTVNYSSRLARPKLAQRSTMKKKKGS
jgi:hypothetical protein